MTNRDSLSRALFGIGVLALATGAAGCLPSLNDPDYGPLTSTFAVSDIFSPSGFMGDGANPGYLTVDFKEEHCKQPRPPGAQGKCYTFTYYMDPKGGMNWAGVYWVYPTNSWGARPGYAIDSTKFQQVRFWAAVDTPNPHTANNGGNTVFNAVVGHINGRGFYGDPCMSINQHGCEHEDKIDTQETYTVGETIGPEMKQFHVPLGAQPVTDELIGAFAWSMSFPSDSCTCLHPDTPNPSLSDCATLHGEVTCPTPVTVHLDDIVWDTAPPPAQPTP